MEQAVIQRFWSKIDKRSPAECWPWKAGTFRTGYGQFKTGRRSNSRLATRVMMELCGYDVSGRFVCHRCDNPLCVNPGHLFLGTTQDNTRDRQSKGRQARGERQGSSVMTMERVLELRKCRERGDTFDALAAAFGISKSQVANIVRGRHWRHV